MIPASPPTSAKQRKGGFAFALGLLAGIGIAVAASGWIGSRPRPPDSATVMNIGDGSGMMGREILAAAALLSNERAVRIEYSHQGGKGAIGAVARSSVFESLDEPMTVRITPWRIEMDGEEVSGSVFRERLQFYVEAAKLTNSRPSLLVSCSDGVDASRLVEVLSVLVDTGIDSIRLADHRWLFDPRPTKPPPPQIKPLAHPVELP